MEMTEKRDDFLSPEVFDLLGDVETSHPAFVGGAGHFVHAQVVQRVCPSQKAGRDVWERDVWLLWEPSE